MFFHNLKYTLIFLFKNKMLIFWTFAFPIILATFFNMAFSNIENNEKLDILNIAIVDSEELKEDKILMNTFNYLADDTNKDQLFSITYTDLDNANKLLEDKDIIGYLKNDGNDITVTVKLNGIKETIFKFVVDEIILTKQMISDLATDKNTNINVDYEKIYQMVNDNASLINDTSPSNLSYTMIEYYTLIAMTCLYGGTIGMYAINNMLANMSKKGSRIAVSPIKKISLLLSGTLAAFIVQLIGVLLLFIYTILVLDVDYGNNLLPVILIAVVGSLAGLTMGIMIASLFKKNENTKIGIIISITMLLSFLSGMMGITMKYIIDKNIPILNIINPANMITDGLYSLYYYDTMNRYYYNIAGLLLFSLLMILLSFRSLRRQKYDSI